MFVKIRYEIDDEDWTTYINTKYIMSINEELNTIEMRDRTWYSYVNKDDIRNLILLLTDGKKIGLIGECNGSI